MRLDDGTIKEVRGLVEGEAGGALLVRTASSPKPLEIPKSRIVSQEEDDCDPTEIYPPPVLAERKKAEIDPQDARGWFRLARYCEGVQAWAEAKEAFETAASDETFLNREAAREGAKRMAAVLADKEALDSLANLRNLLGFNQFKTVREGIESFPTKHPEASDAVKKQLETLKEKFEAKRKAFFAGEASKQFVDVLRRAIDLKVRPKQAQINEVLSWTRKELVDEAFAELLLRFQKRDPAVTAEETKGFWDARPKKGWRVAKYGSGSFLIEPGKLKPSQGTPRPSSGGSRGGSSGPQVTIPIPKPPTRDAWWEKAEAQVRLEWVFASFVEKSGLFEVAPQRDRANCDTCNGEGLMSKMLSNGQLLQYLCPRCGGARYDLSIKYR
jgi:hypothetical protein